MCGQSDILRPSSDWVSGGWGKTGGDRTTDHGRQPRFMEFWLISFTSHAPSITPHCPLQPAPTPKSWAVHPRSTAKPCPAQQRRECLVLFLLEIHPGLATPHTQRNASHHFSKYTQHWTSYEFTSTRKDSFYVAHLHNDHLLHPPNISLAPEVCIWFFR